MSSSALRHGRWLPPGSFSTLIDSAAVSAKASFDVFTIQAGGNVPVINKNLGCDVSITVSFPGSCKQAVLKTRTDAYVLLAQDAGATAKVSTPFSLSGGSIGASPPDLVYNSLAGQNNEVDIGRTYDVAISATGTTATFVAHLDIFLNAPDATLISQTTLDGFGLLISQEGLC
ncbi:hypothetical protein NEMBOFW57_004069 [Staphylotrichum longicolle]|uniref:Uncharacterized protein n=1 Tax=Staphylotrichum longicolle TaxID=669026 RepID=A0AAD4FB27_9PEZI|nr:hypothetical protein NEMBOFW57_004069 [Staphylotrichum longicolle]